MNGPRRGPFFWRCSRLLGKPFTVDPVLPAVEITHRVTPGAASKRPARLDGAVEADETYMLESQKGSRHLDRPPRRRAGVARRRGISREHECLRAGIRARGNIHLNNVNGWHSRFKSWLRRFNGIASHYLRNYSGWQRVLDDGVLCTPAQLLTAIIQYAIPRKKEPN